MPTLNEITTLIASPLGKELDDPFKEMVAQRVDFWRSTLLSRSLEKNPGQEALFRTVLNVKMEPFDDPLAIPGSPPVYRSKVLPARLRYNDGKWKYLGSVDGRNPFRYCDSGQMAYLQSGKYSGNTLFYEDLNGMIVMNQWVPLLRVDDVLDSGMDIMRWQNRGSVEPCEIWDMPYPATDDLLQMILQYIQTVDFERKQDTSNTEIEVNPLDK